MNRNFLNAFASLKIRAESRRRVASGSDILVVFFQSLATESFQRRDFQIPRVNASN